MNITFYERKARSNSPGAPAETYRGSHGACRPDPPFGRRDRDSVPPRPRSARAVGKRRRRHPGADGMGEPDRPRIPRMERGKGCQAREHPPRGNGDISRRPGAGPRRGMVAEHPGKRLLGEIGGGLPGVQKGDSRHLRLSCSACAPRPAGGSSAPRRDRGDPGEVGLEEEGRLAPTASPVPSGRVEVLGIPPLPSLGVTAVLTRPGSGERTQGSCAPPTPSPSPPPSYT